MNRAKAGILNECVALLAPVENAFGISLADGEEIIQETFLALFDHLRKGSRRDNLRGWIFRLTHNLALKRHQF